MTVNRLVWFNVPMETTTTLRTRTKAPYVIVRYPDEPTIVGYAYTAERAFARATKLGRAIHLPVVEGKVTVRTIEKPREARLGGGTYKAFVR